MRIAESWEGMADAARQRSREALKALHRQRIDLGERYGGSASAWDDLDAYRSLYDAWRKAMAEYASDNGGKS